MSDTTVTVLIAFGMLLLIGSAVLCAGVGDTVMEVLRSWIILLKV